MKTPMVAGLLVGIVIATAGGTLAGYKLLQDKEEPVKAAALSGNTAPATQPTHATVLGVDPVSRDVSRPREVCRDEVVTQQATPTDENRIAGTAIGAVVGGLVGNQIVKGDSRKLATVAGAAAGGYAGNQVQKSIQDKQTVSETRQVCETVTNVEQEVVAYNVRYRLGANVDTVEMSYDPGATIPVKDGRLVLR